MEDVRHRIRNQKVAFACFSGSAVRLLIYLLVPPVFCLQIMRLPGCHYRIELPLAISPNGTASRLFSPGAYLTQVIVLPQPID